MLSRRSDELSPSPDDSPGHPGTASITDCITEDAANVRPVLEEKAKGLANYVNLVGDAVTSITGKVVSKSSESGDGLIDTISETVENASSKIAETLTDLGDTVTRPFTDQNTPESDTNTGGGKFTFLPSNDIPSSIPVDTKLSVTSSSNFSEKTSATSEGIVLENVHDGTRKFAFSQVPNPALPETNNLRFSYTPASNEPDTTAVSGKFAFTQPEHLETPTNHVSLPDWASEDATALTLTEEPISSLRETTAERQMRELGEARGRSIEVKLAQAQNSSHVLENQDIASESRNYDKEEQKTTDAESVGVAAAQFDDNSSLDSSVRQHTIPDISALSPPFTAYTATTLTPATHPSLAELPPAAHTALDIARDTLDDAAVATLAPNDRGVGPSEVSVAADVDLATIKLHTPLKPSTGTLAAGHVVSEWEAVPSTPEVSHATTIPPSPLQKGNMASPSLSSQQSLSSYGDHARATTDDDDDVGISAGSDYSDDNLERSEFPDEFVCDISTKMHAPQSSRSSVSGALSSFGGSTRGSVSSVQGGSAQLPTSPAKSRAASSRSNRARSVINEYGEVLDLSSGPIDLPQDPESDCTLMLDGETVIARGPATATYTEYSGWTESGWEGDEDVMEEYDEIEMGPMQFDNRSFSEFTIYADTVDSTATAKDAKKDKKAKEKEKKNQKSSSKPAGSPIAPAVSGNTVAPGGMGVGLGLSLDTNASDSLDIPDPRKPKGKVRIGPDGREERCCNECSIM